MSERLPFILSLVYRSTEEPYADCENVEVLCKTKDMYHAKQAFRYMAYDWSCKALFQSGSFEVYICVTYKGEELERLSLGSFATGSAASEALRWYRDRMDYLRD